MFTLNPQQFASWNEPIEMLYACHSKVKKFCRQLQLLPDYLEKQGVNQAVKNDVEQILNYFNLSAPLHHDDEEKDFFPTLIKKFPKAVDAVKVLEQQHTELHHNWDLLEEQLLALLTGKRTNVDRELIKRFVEGYNLHISIEEPLFELGREYLSESDLKAIGKIMENRRKV
ncbi:hypothetical protein A6B43_07430 [Vespertiliibacter pulmonis]|uniref:Hemerythrin HHE cation binding domain-containing protein n=1 Tax=Vespertiliibacter pulmonis TaxID=1443036 RepID=A0A3N4WKW4_9PAST|nr:hemerythrin domain-containing protein [Vespertiliibacter pulmonis]QLB21363.1 hypothetical protein A6B43_07430 [Vespertiliibacter pulmonis]RPE85774.1 hemerythrin HHE cation binding domain-containing protein [Vespertiliibacter pulmonis]